MNAALEKLRERRALTASLQNEVGLSGLTLDTFAGSGRTLCIYSRVLNEEVLLAADNAAISPDETRTIYRASELRELLDATPEGLRLLHEVKTVFPGSEIISDTDHRKEINHAA